MKRFLTLICFLWIVPRVAFAAEFVLQLPLGAKSTYSKIETTFSPLVPIGPFGGAIVPKIRASDHIRRTVWALRGNHSLAEMQAGIQEQLERAGYTVLLDCVSDGCGGFDFRFNIDVVPEPMMYVDLRDFRFITARQSVSDNPTTYITFLLSRSPVSVFVQITEYSPIAFDERKLEVTAAPVTQSTRSGQALSADNGFMILEGLVFPTGSTKLGGDPNGAIAALAEVLKAEPDMKVLLVGHSDLSGSLNGNITVSKRRAESVRQELVNKYGISASRLSTHGIGYLAPRADNQTDAGKVKNRRVEAVFVR